MLSMYKVVQDEEMIVYLEREKILSIDHVFVNNSTEAIQVFEEFINPQKYPTEHIWLMAVSNAVEVYAIVELAIGTGNEAYLSMREVFQASVLLNARGVIIAHNHPSGFANASQADLVFSERLEKTGELLGVVMIDHLIVGRGEFWSWKGYKGGKNL